MNPAPSTEIDLWGEFRDAETERRFRVSRLADAHTQLRGTLIFAGVFFLAFFVTDFASLGVTRTAFMLLGLRLAVTAVIVACWLMVRRHPASTTALQAAGCTVALVTLAAFEVVTWCRPADLPWLTMSMSVILVVLYLYVPHRLGYAVLMGVPASAVFSLVVFLQGGAPGQQFFSMALILAAYNVFGYMAALRHQTLWRKEYLVQARLERLSFHDQLTDCYNRRYLHDRRLDADLQHAWRSGRPVTVILCDIDHFKNINDTFGHQAGDSVLAAVALQLRSGTRQDVDAVVRYGGEEFLLILPGTDLASGTRLAERLRANVAATPVPTRDGPAIRLTASFGVASADLPAAPLPPNLYELIGSADALLYESKKGGRNQVRTRQLA